MSTRQVSNADILRVHMDSAAQLLKESLRLQNENERLRALLARALTLLDVGESDIYRFSNNGDGYSSVSLDTAWEEKRNALVPDVKKALESEMKE